MTFLTFRKKTLSIYKDFKQKAPNPAEVAHFNASSGCFSGFMLLQFLKPSGIRQNHK